MGGVLGAFFPDLDQSITELLVWIDMAQKVLSYNLVASDGPKHYVPEIILDLGQASVGASQWHQYLHPPGTTCIILLH